MTPPYYNAFVLLRDIFLYSRLKRADYQSQARWIAYLLFKPLLPPLARVISLIIESISAYMIFIAWQHWWCLPYIMPPPWKRLSMPAAAKNTYIIHGTISLDELLPWCWRVSTRPCRRVFMSVKCHASYYICLRYFISSHECAALKIYFILHAPITDASQSFHIIWFQFLTLAKYFYARAQNAMPRAPIFWLISVSIQGRAIKGYRQICLNDGREHILDTYASNTQLASFSRPYIK